MTLSGTYLGYVIGKKQSNQTIVVLSSTYDDSVATNLINNVKNLEYLQNGKIDKSRDLLETLIDFDVSYLNVKLKDKKYALFKDERILEAIGYAKKYRKQYPEHQPKPITLKKEVEEAFRNISGR